MNLQVSGCGSQEIGPRKPPSEETPATASLQKPPVSRRKRWWGKHLRAHTRNRFYKAPAFKERRTARGLPLDFILTRQAAAVALPANGTQAVKPCPLGSKGKANAVPSEGAQVGMTKLRGLTGEGWRGGKWRRDWLGRGEGRKEPLCWPPFPHRNPQEQQQSVMQIVTPPPA